MSRKSNKRVRQIMRVIGVATLAVLVGACGGEEPASSTVEPTKPTSPTAATESKRVEPAPSSPSSTEVRATEQQAQSVPETERGSRNVEPRLTEAARESSPDNVETIPYNSEPSADAVAATMALETELNEIVAAASAKLEPDEAARLMGQVDEWLQHGFGCPDGPEKFACQQFHLRSRIKEINHRMRGYSTEY